MCFTSGILDHNRHDKDRGLLSPRLRVNYKQEKIQLKLVKVSSTASWGAGGGGRRPLAHSKILLKASEVVVPHGSRFETDVWLVNCGSPLFLGFFWRVKFEIVFFFFCIFVSSIYADIFFRNGRSPPLL